MKTKILLNIVLAVIICIASLGCQSITPIPKVETPPLPPFNGIFMDGDGIYLDDLLNRNANVAWG